MSFLRRLRWVYAAYNLLHRHELAHLRAAYRRYGVKKWSFAPVTHRDFDHLPGERPWLDREDSREALPQRADFTALSPSIQDAVRDWSTNGYAILRGYFSADQVTAANAAVARLRATGKARIGWNEKIMFAFRTEPELAALAEDPQLIELLSLLLGHPMRAFQSINFLRGSRQATHSDTIHMTTHPLGYMTAAWIALEPVDPANGTIHYYPGSHRLPYVLNGDFPDGGNALLLGPEANKNYEKHIARLLGAHPELEKQTFRAEPGDVFLWHANLLHGGEPIQDPERTRRSMVVHYFSTETINYHEITGRPALWPT